MPEIGECSNHDDRDWQCDRESPDDRDILHLARHREDHGDTEAEDHRWRVYYGSDVDVAVKYHSEPVDRRWIVGSVDDGFAQDLG